MKILDDSLGINSFNFLRGNILSSDHFVDSVANRFLMFRGDVFHSSTVPTHEAVRINTNYNFTTK